VVILNEGMPFLREINTDIQFVRLTVGNIHNSSAIVDGDVHSAVTVKVLHTVNNPLLLRAYSRYLGHVIPSTLGLTTFIGESCR